MKLGCCFQTPLTWYQEKVLVSPGPLDVVGHGSKKSCYRCICLQTICSFLIVVCAGSVYKHVQQNDYPNWMMFNRWKAPLELVTWCSTPNRWFLSSIEVTPLISFYSGLRVGRKQWTVTASGKD